MYKGIVKTASECLVRLEKCYRLWVYMKWSYTWQMIGLFITIKSSCEFPATFLTKFLNLPVRNKNNHHLNTGNYNHYSDISKFLEEIIENIRMCVRECTKKWKNLGYKKPLTTTNNGTRDRNKYCVSFYWLVLHIKHQAMTTGYLICYPPAQA